MPAFSSFSIVFVAPVVFSWLQRAGGQGKGEVGKVKMRSRSCKVEVAKVNCDRVFFRKVDNDHGLKIVLLRSNWLF